MKSALNKIEVTSHTEQNPTVEQSWIGVVDTQLPWPECLCQTFHSLALQYTTTYYVF